MSEKANEKTKAIATLVILVITLVNQALQLLGYSTIPFAPEKVELFISMGATFVVSIYAWWKNQNVTRAAREAQRVLDMKKQK